MRYESKSKISARYMFRHLPGRSLIATSLLALGVLSSTAWADSRGISLVNISENAETFGSVFPRVKVSPTNPTRTSPESRCL